MEAGGKETNYWPGFVDAMTNVVVALVFVVIVLALALSMFVQLLAQRQVEKMVAERLAEIAEKANGSAPATPPKTPPAAVGTAGPGPGSGGAGAPPAPQAPAPSTPAPTATPTPNTQAPKAGTDLKRGGDIAAEAADTPKVEKDAIVSTKSGEFIVVTYPAGALRLDEKAIEDLKKLILAGPPPASSTKVSITVLQPLLSLTDNRRMAYVRAVDIRNVLLGEGHQASAILIQLKDGEPGQKETKAKIAFGTGSP